MFGILSPITFSIVYPSRPLENKILTNPLNKSFLTDDIIPISELENRGSERMNDFSKPQSCRVGFAPSPAETLNCFSCSEMCFVDCSEQMEYNLESTHHNK